ncbi:hypothetical protein BB558_005305 [Smittium angustum]|uniref:DNA replication licensing factor MCM2 n=1 Tax=Smittium angustum TaxID=133377 RepID=A0A2U1J0U9_SMIAN|nr:hypothetical protein BB558_005305 [Smittium angustum]
MFQISKYQLTFFLENFTNLKNANYMLAERNKLLMRELAFTRKQVDKLITENVQLQRAISIQKAELESKIENNHHYYEGGKKVTIEILARLAERIKLLNLEEISKLMDSECNKNFLENPVQGKRLDRDMKSISTKNQNKKTSIETLTKNAKRNQTKRKNVLSLPKIIEEETFVEDIQETTFLEDTEQSFEIIETEINTDFERYSGIHTTLSKVLKEKDLEIHQTENKPDQIIEFDESESVMDIDEYTQTDKINQKNTLGNHTLRLKSSSEELRANTINIFGFIRFIRLKDKVKSSSSSKNKLQATKSKQSDKTNKKRTIRNDSDDSDDEITFPQTPGGGVSYVSSPAPYHGSALPPSSPPPFSPFTPQYTGIHSDDEIDDEAANEIADEAQEADIDEENDNEDEGELLALDEEEADGEDLFGSDMEKDYRDIDGLDDYEGVDLDDNEYASIDPSDRAKIEARLRRRDLEEGRGINRSRIPAAFLQAMDEDGWDGHDIDMNKRRRRRFGGEKNIHAALLDGTLDIDDEERALTLEDLKDIKGDSISVWINEAGPRQAIAREFRHFLLSYVDEKGSSVYGERIRRLGEVNGESLEVDYSHLAASKPLLGYFLINSPREMLSVMDDLAMDAVLTVFPDYARIRPEIHVRISEIPAISTLRDLRQSQLNTLVRVSGVVSRRTSVFPQLKYVKFDCGKCGAVLGPFYQDNRSEVKIGSCTNCQSRGPFSINSENTVYRNYQKITLQETPGSVPPGRLPRHREIVLLWDLIDIAKPGEEIEVTGTYCHSYDASLNARQGFPVFTTIIEANHILKRSDEFAAFRLTEEDRREIRALSRSEDLERRLIKSIAPSIYGHLNIKTALCLCMFGGVSKDIGGKLRTRGDINILLLGDPGTAKSQFLKYIETTAHRAVFTTGQGASAVGLTASVRKDPVTREWTLEGGALVLADRGICLIDEFDKMNDADRTSIHEAMEQQSISISKAGIVASLQARCSVIAAANPIGGRYRPSFSFSQNVNLTEPILSRFDVLCVVRDEVDPIQDELLGRFVVGSHIRSHPDYETYGEGSEETQESQLLSGLSGLGIDNENNQNNSVEPIPQDLLKKYIMYARENITPKFQKVDIDKVTHLYSELRRESLATGGIPITVRHIDAIVRLCEARARMHLREYVRSDDLDVAIKVTLSSFISAQKLSVSRTLKRQFSKYLTASSDFDELLYLMLSKLVQEKVTFYQFKNQGNFPSSVEISYDELESQARSSQIFNLRSFYTSKILKDYGFVADSKTRTIIKKFDV